MHLVFLFLRKTNDMKKIMTGLFALLLLQQTANAQLTTLPKGGNKRRW